MTESRNVSKPIGVIEALSTGYRLLNRAWSVWLIPLSLDLLFWLGPQISPWAALRSLFEQLDPDMRSLLATNMGLDALDWSQPPPGPNLLTLVSLGPGAPSTLASTFGFLPAPDIWPRPMLSVGSPWGLVGLMLALLFVSAPISGLYLALASRAVEKLPWSPTPHTPAPPFGNILFDLKARRSQMKSDSLAERWQWIALHLVLLTALFVFIAGIMVVGLSVGMALGLLMNPALGAVIAGIGTLMLTWLLLLTWVLFYFTPASIALDRQTAWQALSRSAKVVARNLGSSMGLILISLLIAEGFALIWRRFFFAWPGVLLSLAGNAYLTSGLTLAAFIFYRDRHARLVDHPITSMPSSHTE